METMYSINYPVELVGFDHTLLLHDPQLLVFLRIFLI
jgi:hypothetical protein